MTAPIELTPIGHVRTRYAAKSDTPVQSVLNAGETGRAVLDEPYRPGLSGLDGFDHAWLLTWLAPDPDDPVPVGMRQVPFLLTGERRELGLFAMRGPRRPNPIGLHLVRIAALHDDGFEFGGVDLLDRTALLDVKPYAAPLDVPAGHRIEPPLRSGWFDEADLSRPHTPRSLRGGDVPLGAGPDGTMS
jgi:tRNA (adenine37-N6)-methyltransferase